MTFKVRARAPLRLGLAGGGSDLSPYCDTYTGYVLNATIDKYAYTSISRLSEGSIRLASIDQDISIEFSSTEDFNLDKKLILHKAVYDHIISTYNDSNPIFIELITYCEAPFGSGLGSSSTLVVSMIQAFNELLSLSLDDYQIAHMAHYIERVTCKLQGGRQDQYSATFGGFNFMEFHPNDLVIVNPLRVKKSTISQFESTLLLYFSGISRNSASIIADQTVGLNLNKSNVLNAMHSIKNEAVLMKKHLLQNNFSELINSISCGWEHKKATSNYVSNPEIEKCYELALNSGALTGKISGAGGGGFIWFIVPLEKRKIVTQCLNELGGSTSSCHFVSTGSESWRYL